MMQKLLNVWKDLYGRYECAGALWKDGGSVLFQYDETYGGTSISVSLPLQEAPLTETQTRVFFAALNPEGPARRSIAKIIRMDDSEYEPLLERLNDETSGALVFTTADAQPGSGASYLPIDQSFFDFFAESPASEAVKTLTETRLSLSGAMAKIGLYRDDETLTWHLPTGAAPSNFIVKAGSSLFPHEILNEAMCLDVARRCGFPAAEAEVIRTASGTPLLAVKRYDRIEVDEPRRISGMPAPLRLHQEDFCQVCGLESTWKYEPSEGDYLKRIAGAASRHCDNSFGEAQLLLEYVMFDYLIGNCDNHLKNFSILYDRNWRSKEISPLYDDVCTMVYSSLLTEMGVSLSPNRSVFGLTRGMLEEAIGNAGLPVKLGMGNYDELAASIEGAVEGSRDQFLADGFPDARPLADLFIDGIRKRAAFDYSASNAKTL